MNTDLIERALQISKLEFVAQWLAVLLNFQCSKFNARDQKISKNLSKMECSCLE